MSKRRWPGWLELSTACGSLLWASTAAAIPTGPYFPLPDGATWTYARSSGGSETRTVTGSTNFNGAQVRVVQYESGSQQYFTNDASGIRFHGAYVVDFVNGGTETDTYAPPVVLAAGDMSIGVPVGSSGTVFASHTVFGSITVSYTATSVLVSIDPAVTVPAGTFANVAHVQTTISYSYAGGSFYQTEDVWLASGIGVIRETIFDSSGPQTETFQLVSYNVPDTIPDAFSFAPKTAQSSGTFVVSDPITVSGVSAPAPISVTGGEYRVNGGAFTGVSGTVNNGNQVTVRVVSAQPGQSATATLDIGGVTATFAVTTSADTTPSPFSFTPVTGAPIGVPMTSSLVVVSDINAPAPISIVGGEYSVSGQPFTTAPGTVDPFASVRVRVVSASGYGATTSATLTIGGVSATFSVTTQSPGQGTASVLYYASQPGDWIGQGETRVLSFGPSSTLTVSRNSASGVSVSIFQGSDWFFLDLAAPGSRALRPGRYEGAIRFPFHGDGAGLSFSGNGRGCNMLTGRFDVLDVAYAPDGTVLRLAANLEQHCEGGVPALFGEFRFNSTILLGDRAIRGRRADLDGDGRADILWHNAATGDVALFLMDGLGLMDSPVIGNINPAWSVVGVGDFDGDGRADILWRNAATGDNAIFLMAGSTIIGSRLIGSVNPAWSVVGVGDFDGDGKADILWRNTSTGDTAIFLMDGFNLRSSALISSVPITWTIAGVGDFDGDGKADILWRSAGTGDNAIFLMDGFNLTRSALIPSVPTSWAVINK